MALVWTVLTIGFYFQQSWITWVWPWHDQRMTYIFFASIAAAVAGPLGWIAVVNEPAAIAGMTLDGLVITSLITIGLIVMAITRSDSRLFLFAAGTAIAAIFSAAMFRQFRTYPVTDGLAQPRLVTWVFAVLVAALFTLGVMLLFRTSNVFPWDLPGRTSTMIGTVFIGAGTWFTFGLIRRIWVHSGGQLIGLLAYDIVLIVPYWRAVAHRNAISSSGGYGTFPDTGTVIDRTQQANTPSLFIYTAVITASALFGCFYLFVNPATRMRWRASVLQSKAYQEQ